MSPLGLESHGLPDVLAALAERTTKRFGLKIDLRCANEGLRFANPEVAIHLYRIAQEAVQNAVKHARATRLEIGLASSDNRLHLVVRDNGRGLPARPPRRGGLGLRIMQYRAGMIGATIAIERDPAGGTVVSCSVDHRVATLLPPAAAHPHEKTRQTRQTRRPANPRPARR
ncbi:MAG: sensor histidine kinase [Verrucomicrobiota bacterium]